MKDEMSKKDEQKLKEMQKEIDEAEAAEAAGTADADATAETADASEGAGGAESTDGAAEAAENADDLQKKVETLAAALQEKDNRLKRLQADFENFRRRSAKERLELIETASEKIILDLLPVIDDFERALKALGESEDNSSAKQGTELIYNKLNAVLTSKGLKKIEAVGAEFDVDMMEAVAQFPAADPEQKGKVIDTVQNGYKLGEKVIRYAKVVVAQ